MIEINREFRIGEWRVDPTRNRIQSTDGSKTLEPLVMALLVRLASANGEVVTRTELLEEVWRDRVVNEEALFRAISELRKAFDDDPQQPRFIETIRKRGYRLASPVEIGIEVPAKGSRWLLRVGALLVVIVVGSWLVIHFSSRSDNVAPRAASRPLTSYPGREIDPAISPDGERVVFAWNDTDDYELYVKDISGSDPVRLTEQQGFEGHPAWSPDGSQIAFVAERADGSYLEVIDALGGTPRQLRELDQWSFGLDWSPDGRYLALSQPFDLAAMKIVLLHIESGEMLPPRVQGIDQREYKPVFSPDGERLAFLRGDDSGLASVWIVELNSGSVRQASQPLMQIRGMDWTPDGEHLILSASVGAEYRLWSLPVGGDGQLVLLDGIASQPFNPTVSKTGRLAYESVEDTVNVWKHEVESGSSTPVAESTRQDWSPDLSADEGQLVFISDRTGSTELWLADAEGDHVRQLTDLKGSYVAYPRFSPGGGKILFQSQAEGRSIIAMASAVDGRVQTINLGDRHAFPIRWLDDDSLIALISNDDVWYSVAIGTGGRILQDLGPGMALDDGQNDDIWIDSGNLSMHHRNSYGEDSPIFGPVMPYAWAFGRESFYFAPLQAQQLKAYSRNTGELRDFVELPEFDLGQFSVTSDGKAVYYGRIDESRSDLYWRDL